MCRCSEDYKLVHYTNNLNISVIYFEYVWNKHEMKTVLFILNECDAVVPVKEVIASENKKYNSNS